METSATPPALMRLSVPRGWAIGDNKFFDVAPRPDPADHSRIENWSEGFVEDVLWLCEWRYRHTEPNPGFYIPEQDCYSIDLGWYPDSRSQGEYTLRLQWCAKDEPVTVVSFSSPDRYAIRDTLEQWLGTLAIDYHAHRSPTFPAV